MQNQKPSVLAVGAHPDDIEFRMAGTLLLLREQGCEIHYLNLASGSCGSQVHGPAQLRRIRRGEAQAAARILGAVFHPSLVDDLEILYDLKLLRRVSAIIRQVNPGIILTHYPRDYMEDHMNTCRLVVTAAFVRGAPNFRTVPPQATVDQDVVIYHAMPHGLQDELRQPIRPEALVDVTAVHATKLAALSQHRSQHQWLEASQGMNSYLQTMEDTSQTLGRMSGRFQQAEGWRRHLHLGFSQVEKDPLRELLGSKFCPVADLPSDLSLRPTCRPRQSPARRLKP